MIHPSKRLYSLVLIQLIAVHGIVICTERACNVSNASQLLIRSTSTIFRAPWNVKVGEDCTCLQCVDRRPQGHDLAESTTGTYIVKRSVISSTSLSLMKQFGVGRSPRRPLLCCSDNRFSNVHIELPYSKRWRSPRTHQVAML